MNFEKKMAEQEKEREMLELLMGMMIDSQDEERTYTLRALKAYGAVMTESRKIIHKLMQEEKEHDGVLTDAGKATAEQLIMIMENTLGTLEGLVE